MRSLRCGSCSEVLRNGAACFRKGRLSPRVAVLVAAKRIEMPRRGAVQINELQRAERVLDRKAGEKPAPVWRGIVRTSFEPVASP